MQIRGLLDTLIGFLVGKASGNILLHFGEGGDCEVLPIASVIVQYDFFKTVLLDDTVPVIINTGVKQDGHL